MDLRLYPGDVLAGKYRIERVVAQGGMGVVVAATHLSLEQPVALKLMLPEVMSNADAVRRFEREARTVARLRSEHVSRVHDVGELESGVPYIAMEYLEGEDLGTLLARGDEIPLADGIEYVLHAADALAEAHALGIVHRDVKPENLFVTQRRDGSPLVKVLDFGISKVVERSPRDRAHTTTQDVMGSPAYMAPEQLVSTRDVDERADVWGLGAILYEIACGRPAFEAETILQLCARVLHEPHTPLAERCPDLPRGFSEVVERCLAKDRDQRFSTIVELASALEPWTPERARPVLDRILAMGTGDQMVDGLADGWSERGLALAPSGALGAPDPERDDDDLDEGRSRTAVAWGESSPRESGRARAIAVAVALSAAAIAAWAANREPIAAALGGREVASSVARGAEPTAQAGERAEPDAGPISSPEPQRAAPSEPTAPEVAAPSLSVAAPAPTQSASVAAAAPSAPPPRAASRPAPRSAPRAAPVEPPRREGRRAPSPEETDVYSVRK